MVTGEQGKARDDVLAGLRRRGWAGRLIWAFAPVQDRHAAPRVAAALRDLAALPEVEVVIVARGGGSLADLFAFCDETLCRTVALLRVPVISSVGPPHRPHADRRRGRRVLLDADPRRRGRGAGRLPPRPGRARHPRSPAARPRRRRAVLDRARALGSMSRAPAEHVARHRRRLHQLLRELRASARRAGDRAQTPDLTPAPGPRAQRRPGAAAPTAPAARAISSGLSLALAAHDPQRTMARGYALVADRDGTPLGSAAAARAAGELELRFHDGSVPAQVTERRGAR